MLFCYPISAVSDNWLHDCINDVMRSIHHLVTSSSSYNWPDVIPVAYRSRLSGRNSLNEKLTAYYKKLKKINSADREKIIQAFTNQNRIADLLSCVCDADTINDLPVTIKKEVIDLFNYLFGLLTDLGIRDVQYAEIYRGIPSKLCPFCGDEFFSAVGAPREDLDHYLLKSVYPFAAANLNNLVPMGGKCNRQYKKQIDILRKDDGTRRRSLNPYNCVPIRISLNNSVPFAGSDGRLPRWVIDFSSTTEETETWNEIFKLKERYQRDILDIGFWDWIMECFKFCKMFSVPITTKTEIINAIEKYALAMEAIGLNDRSFIKAAAFRMLHTHCVNGNERLFEIINDIAASQR